MIDKENPKILEALLSSILDGDEKIIFLPRAELSVDTTEEKVKTGDLIILLDGKYVNLEVKTGVGPETRAKNFTFFCSFYKKNGIKGEKVCGRYYVYSNNITLWLK